MTDQRNILVICCDQPEPAEQVVLGQALTDAGDHAIRFGKEHDGGAINGFERTEYPRKTVEGPSWAPCHRDTYLGEG